MKHRRMALIDVDGTLFGGMSSETAFILDLLRQGRLGRRQCLSAAWFFLRWGLRYGRYVAKKNKAYLNGLAEADVAAWAEDFVTRRLLPRIRPVMRGRLAEHRRGGDFIVLLTGTPSFIAAPLAAALHADGFIATRCAATGGRFTAAPPAVHPFGREKLQRAADLGNRHGLSLSQAVAYADSHYDLPLLSYVDRPVAVFPDRGLKAAAHQYAWEIIDGDHRSPLKTAVEI